MKRARFIATLGATALIGAIGVGSTFAYLTSQTEAVTNTFSVGDVEISLDETDYDDLRERAWREGQVCHGEYNQHNVLMLKSDHLGTAVTNFGHWSFDIQIADLYRFMRKILEKYNWNLDLAGEMLREYHKIRPISAEEWKNLRVRFTYPEKYWKLANYYYSHKKVWISEKNVEKLLNLIRQREIWENFAEECFRDYPR